MTSDEKPTVIQITLLNIMCHFSLILSLTLGSLTKCVGVFFFEFVLFYVCWASLITIFGKFPMIISSNISSTPFSLSSLSETPTVLMFDHLKLSRRFLSCSFLKIFFFYFFKLDNIDWYFLNWLFCLLQLAIKPMQ